MRYQPIPPTLFNDRRKEFTKKMIKGSLAVFYSNDPMPRSGDQFFPYRQDSDLFSLSGLDQPETIIVLYPSAKNTAHREMAFILAHDPQYAIWHGDRYSTKEAKSISGIDKIHTIDKWDRIMPGLFRSVDTIYLNPRQQERFDTPVFSQNDRMAETLKKLYPQKKFLDAHSILKHIAMIKHPMEIGQLKKAVDITGKAFDRVLHTIKPGMKEYEVEAELGYIINQNGCHHAFEPIVASGKSACILHYIRNDRIIKEDELVLIDFGAEYAHMASDMTRTIPSSGRFSKRQKAIYLAVLKILDEITAIMRPGITLEQLNKETEVLIERELLQLKIISKTDVRKQDPASPLRRKYFMHGVSHHLGYDVHDKGERTVPLKAGMVLTCEPGLYIPEEQIGIRLENDILITRGKPRNLMDHIPIHPDEIESIMNA